MKKICINKLQNRPGGNRGYNNHGDRKRGIAGLRKLGYNHFVCYCDTQSDYAIQYGKADWVKPGEVYINR